MNQLNASRFLVGLFDAYETPTDVIFVLDLYVIGTNFAAAYTYSKARYTHQSFLLQDLRRGTLWTSGWNGLSDWGTNDTIHRSNAGSTRCAACLQHRSLGCQSRRSCSAWCWLETTAVVCLLSQRIWCYEIRERTSWFSLILVWHIIWEMERFVACMGHRSL